MTVTTKKSNPVVTVTMVDYIDKVVTLNARRFKVDPTMKEDLISEGYVAAFQLLNGNEVVTESKLSSVILTAMHDYLNLKNLPVTVPIGGNTREVLSRNFDLDKAKPHQKILHMVKKAQHKPIDQDLTFEDEPSTILEEKDLLDKVVVFMHQLPDRQFDIIFPRYFQGLTQQEVGDKLGLSKQYVSTQESQALKALKKVLYDV